MMTRRDLLRLGGSSLLWASLAPSLKSAIALSGGAENGRLFFEPADVARIQANARTELLAPLFREWAARPPEALAATFDQFEASGDVIGDFGKALREMGECATVQLVQPSRARRDVLLAAIERVIGYSHWDYFRDGPTDVIGIQRAPLAVDRLLFVREVLWEDFDEDLNRRLLKAIAEKGCLPTYRTIHGMDDPSSVIGWRFDDRHAGHYDISLERWPMILGANNLRAVPTGGLGLGALALLGHDPRAELWLDTAVSSSHRFLDLISPDGSYFEGLSYINYALHTLLPFLEAHQRIVGDIRWVEAANFDGVIDYIITMQAGKTPSGEPDIVNFSDAKRSVIPAIPAWIGKETENPLAPLVVQKFSQPQSPLDFLWYRRKKPQAMPPAALENVCNDLQWVLCHSGWAPEDAVLAFRSGGPANHEHADRNHFLYKIYGERLLNDHFGASYDRREPGWALRLTGAHNAVLVDGKGHTYHDGIEGTNDSKAYASIINYRDEGDRVWWTSDASAAYLLDNYHLFRVYRTVLFAKPDIVVVLDQVRLRYRPQRVDIRYFPDNADGEARLEIADNRFALIRPHARLDGCVVARSKATLTKTKLDVPPEVGNFPCIEVGSDKATDHEILTVMAASPSASEAREDLSAEAIDDGWQIAVGGLQARILTGDRVPVVEFA